MGGGCLGVTRPPNRPSNQASLAMLSSSHSRHRRGDCLPMPLPPHRHSNNPPLAIYSGMHNNPNRPPIPSEHPPKQHRSQPNLAVGVYSEPPLATPRQAVCSPILLSRPLLRSPRSPPPSECPLLNPPKQDSLATPLLRTLTNRQGDSSAILLVPPPKCLLGA